MTPLTSFRLVTGLSIHAEGTAILPSAFRSRRVGVAAGRRRALCLFLWLRRFEPRAAPDLALA